MSRSDSKIKLTEESGAGCEDDGTLPPPPVPESVPIPGEVPTLAERDGRSTAVWRQWLASMASDAEAALAAAIAYRDMDGAGREEWLRSLEFDAPEVPVPAVALYAPLLAVEGDPERRERLLDKMGADSLEGQARSRQRSLRGIRADGAKVYVVATPLYLDFVQVLACAVKDGKFLWVKHDPIVGPSGVPRVGEVLEGARLEVTPVKASMDELALAVLSHQRFGLLLPEGLSVLSDLLGPLGP